MRTMILGALLLLAGCATPQPAIEEHTSEVDVPVAKSCAVKKDIPAEPAKVNIPANSDARWATDQLGALAGDLRQWGEKVAATLAGCAD